MRKRDRKAIWIYRDDETNEIWVCSDWEGGKTKNNFTKTEAKKIFEKVKAGVQEVFPDSEINPWDDAEHGIMN